jgi:hypothetical protein
MSNPYGDSQEVWVVYSARGNGIYGVFGSREDASRYIGNHANHEYMDLQESRLYEKQPALFEIRIGDEAILQADSHSEAYGLLKKVKPGLGARIHPVFEGDDQ